MNKLTEILEYYQIYMFDITNPVDVRNLLLRIWDELKGLQQKSNQLETSIATKDSELLQLKEELMQLKTNRDDVIKEIKKRSTLAVAQLYIEILERGKE